MIDKALHATFNWAGGTHRFALPMEETHGLHQRHGVTDPHPRLHRLLTHGWSVEDVTGTIRGGLIGGRSFKALDPELDSVIRTHVLRRPLAEGATLARAILLVALFGVPADTADTPVDAATVGDTATDAHAEAVKP